MDDIAAHTANLAQ